jgi:hypothetical protein
MIRPFALYLAAGVALLTATISGADETFPVVHNEPVTVRILGGEDGQPLAHRHLTLIGGYDQSDLHGQIYREEVLTDAHGQAPLPRQLANLPWLQVWVNKKQLCQTKPRQSGFSVELIRRDGLSAPNLCGTATVVDAPGVFTVFVKGNGENVPAGSSPDGATARIPAFEVAPAITPALEARAPKLVAVKDEEPRPAVAESATPQPALAGSAESKLVASETATPKLLGAHTTAATSNPAAAAGAAVLPAAPPSVPVEAALKPVPPAPTPAPMPAKANVLASASSKAAAHRPVRRVAGRRTANRARRVSHKARLVSAACPAQHPAAKAAALTRREGKVAKAPVETMDATGKPKPAAGKPIAGTQPNPNASPKQE